MQRQKSNPLQQDPDRFKLAKAFNFARLPERGDVDYLAVDTYVDAKDTVNNWCVAIVKGINFDEKTVRLGFEGWSSKYDIEIKRNSSKLAPFRTHSIGYTGQFKTAYRDFKMSTTYMAHMEKRLKQIIESNFLNFVSAYECTQFIRGELYFYVDSLLTLQLIITQEDLPAILNFCELVMSLTLKWYEILPQFVPAWTESQATPNLFNVDLAAAVSNCGPELSQIFGKMFGICKRAKQFFVKFKSEYIFDGKYKKEDLVVSNGFLCSLINKLGALNGFARLISFSQRKDIPLAILTNLFCQLKYLHFFVVASEVKEFGRQISQSFEDRLTNITFQELKSTDKDVMRRAINCLETYTRMHNAQTSTGQISETMELQIAFKYLRSPYFELRIRGMNDFKHVFHKVQNRNHNTDDQLRQKELEYAVYLNFEMFNAFMVENEVLELIFTETPHPELIKRSLEILYLRANSTDKNNGMSNKLIDAIWQCCTERHEAVARAAFQVLQDLTQYVPISILETLWTRVSTLEKQEFDEMRVSFLKQYTVGALHALKHHFDKLFRESSAKLLYKPQQQKKQQLPVIQSSNYLDLKIFWTIAQEENTLANQKTKEFAISSLIEILSSIQNYLFQGLLNRLDFLKIALDNLKAGKSVQTSIHFIRRVLKTFNQDISSSTKYTGTQQQNNSLTEQSTRERVIQYLIQEKIFDLVHQNAEAYIKAAQAQSEDLGADSRLANSQFTHKERIDTIITLLEFLIVNSKSSNLDFMQLQNFFNVFVTCAVTPYESEQFFKFLTKENENSSTRERKYLLDERRMTQVFQQIICNQEMLDCGKLGQTGFDCFKMLFLNVNAQTRMLDINQNGQFAVLKLSHLQGFDTAWQICICCKNALVRDQARNFIVDLYLNWKVPDKQRKEVTEAFIHKLETVFSRQNQSGLHPHWLAMVTTFIKRFDYEHITEQSLTAYDKNSNLSIQVTLIPQNIVNIVQVNSNMKIWQLIIQIAKAFKMRASEFRIETSSGPLDTKVYNELISAYNISSIRIKRIDEKVLDRELPRRIIAQNQLLIKKMLENITPKKGIEVLETTIQGTFDLITDLPYNIENRQWLLQEMQKIKKGSSDSNEAWCDLFQLKSSNLDNVSPLTCYYLILLQDIVLPRSSLDSLPRTTEQNANETQERKTLLISFVEKAGLQFLIMFFNAIKKQNLQQKVIKSCTLQVIQKLLIHLLGLQTDLISKSLNQVLVKSLLEQNLLLIQSLTAAMIAKGGATKQNQILMELTLKMVLRIIFLNPLLTTVLYEFENFDSTLLKIYTQLTEESVQAKVSDCLLQICCKIDFQCLDKAGLNLNSFQEQALSLPTFHFLSLILKLIIPATLNIKQNTAVTQQLFLFTNNLLTQTEVFKWLHVIEPVQTLVGDLAAMIRSRPQLEIQAHACDEDFVLTGLLTTLTNILAVQPSVQHQMQIKNQLIKYLLHDCLFLKDTKNQSKNAVQPPKCKTQNSRLKCLQLIRELCVENDTGIALFVEYLRDEVFGGNVSWFWRTARKVDWHVTSENQHERSITGYVGLKNIACICYMNSILQQLYMIPQFRKAMLEVWDRNSSTESKSENCLYQVKRMFAGLNQASKQYYNPKKFCNSFKDIDGSPIDPRIQKDVDEFLNMFIDRIESLIKGTKEEEIMKNLLHGVFANELICKGCPHTSEREEPFMTLQIQVKDKHSILEGLDAFVEGEMLEGDNAYYCEKCDKKRDTLRRCTIKRLPNVLFLNLKRFEFNFDTMSKFKINDYCEFPMSLDMSKYTQDHIKRQDLLREMEEKNIIYEELDREKQAIFNKQQCAEYSQYHLVGIVVHQGTTEQGHYYSFIKERDSSEGNWFTFNDKDISNFNPQNIPEECFGGVDPDFEQRVNSYQHDAAMQQVIIQQGKIKNRNAYVLIYERSQIIDVQRYTELTEDISNALSKQDSSLLKMTTYYQHKSGLDQQQQIQQIFNQCKIQDAAQIQIQADIYTEIQEKNSRFWLTKHIFNKQFMELAYEIFSLKKMPVSLDYHKIKASPPDLTDNNLIIYKFIINFMLTVAQRSSARGAIPSFVKLITAALKNSVALSQWLCETFSCQAIIREMLIECKVEDMSRFTAGMLNTAMQTLFQHEKRGILRYIEELSQLDNFLQSTQASHIKQVITYAVTQERSQDDQPVFTPAEQVKIYKINGSTEELPSLIIMINSFLHYQVSAQMQENYNQHMSAQFQRVICYFAELGPEASLYLLKTGCFSRFLKLFFNQQHDDDVISEVPLFQLDYANQKQSLTRNQSATQNAKIPLLDRKQATVIAISPSLFILRALSLMISQCTTSNQNDTTLYTLKKPEIELLVHEVTNRNWWRSTVLEIPLARNAVSKIWATLCTNDNQQSQIYLKQIFTCIQENNFQTIKRLGRFLLDFVCINDPYQHDRISRVLNLLYETLKKNTQYWKTTDSLIELVIKLSSRCRVFACELSKNSNIIRMIEQITKENPSFPITPHGIKLFKDYNINWASLPPAHKQLVTESKVTAIGNYSKQRLSNFVEILKQQVAGVFDETKDDSDEDCYVTDFREGDQVDVKFSKQNFSGWFTSEVIVVLDVMIRVKACNVVGTTTEGTSMWIEKESYKLAKRGSQTQNERAINHTFFCDLFKLFEAANTAK